MKKHITILIALAVFACKKSEPKPEETATPTSVTNPPAAAFSWKRVSHDSTKNLNKVVFYDTNYGYFISDNFLLRTKNGGQSFTALPLPANMNVLGATVIDSISLIVSYNYSTYKTINGGQTWTALSTSTLSSVLYDGCFINATTGFIGGNNCILKTNDAGVTWQQLNIGNGDFKNVKFTSATTGWADNGSGVAYRTIDGGISWTAHSTGFTSNTNMFFLNDNVAWAYFVDFFTAGKSLKRTTDGGATWQTLFTDNSQFYLWTKLAFTGTDKGFAGGFSGYLASTANGGTSWQSVSTPAFTEHVFNYHFFPDGKGWACGSNGLILKYN